MIILTILDGIGERRNKHGNAVKQAGMPNVDYLKKIYPHTLLNACGPAVGLTKGQFGNSEAGHINMGAGRVIKQDLIRINQSIENGDAFKNKILLNAFKHCIKNNSNLHIMGLASEGGVHSKIAHLKFIIRLAKQNHIKNIYLHLFTDGRDTPINSGISYVNKINNFIKKYKNIKISTISGRFYAMDRENRYERIESAYMAIVNAQSLYNFKTPNECFEYFYNNNIYDEFILPSVINGGNIIQDNDSVIFFNYRNDRAREITSAIAEKTFDKFKTKKLKNLFFAGMTEYDKKFKNVYVIFPPEKKYPPLGEILSQNGLKQFRVSETTKYAHVTFFFNGGREQSFEGEDRKLIESLNINNFEKVPQMRAYEICDEVENAISSKKYDFILVNFSNGDMVGHSANMEATKIAVRVVDECVGRIYKTAKKHNADLIITADHGNADYIITKENTKVTSHSPSKVMFVLASETYKNAKLKKNMPLSTVASTVLKILKIKIPSYFTTKPLF